MWAGHIHSKLAPELRFFEHPDHPFPRIRFDFTNGVSSKSLRAFYNGARCDKELKQVLQRIEPYLKQREWWNREIPVEIVGLAFPNEKMKIQRRWFLPPQRRPSYLKPAFRLVAVRMEPSYSSASTAENPAIRTSLIGNHTFSAAAFRSLSSAFKGIPVYATCCRIEESPEPSVFLLDQEASSRCINVDTIELCASSRGNNHSALVAMCSALPHSRLATALELDHRDLELSKGDGAWLGYALFHPDMATRSSLSTLTLRLPRDISTFADQLSHMATGNNLLLVMGVTSIPSSAYYETRLARRTCVYEDGSKDSPVIYKFPSEQTVTLCITSAEDVKQHDWVRIVVPGLGLGWVQAKLIGSVVARAPGRSSLLRLHLVECPLGDRPRDLSSLTARMLSLLGRSLTHLKIMVNLDNEDLWAVLHSCPDLRALRVKHDGSCWSHASSKPLARSTARLETLELLVSGHLHPLVARELGDMTCLRVINNATTEWHSSPDRTTLVAMLRTYPRLARVYWSNVRDRPWWEKSRYRERFMPSPPWEALNDVLWTPTWDSDPRDWQLTSYGMLGEEIRGVLDTTQSPLPLESRVAFLSVFSRATGGALSSLPPLTPDVVRLVFAYSETPVPRQLLIRHDHHDPMD